MPIRLRNKPNFMDNVILDFLDERNNTRYLIKASHDMSLLPQRTIIIFPKFIEGEEFITQITGRELFQKLIGSVRHSNGNLSMFKDLAEITKHVPSYYIKYDFCDIVSNLLKVLSVE